MKKCIIYVSVMIVLSGLTACGFRPLYGTHQDDALVHRLQSVEMLYRSEPVNQRIARALARLITPEGKKRTPRYALSFDAEATHGALAIQLDQEVTRYKTTVSLQYTLKDKQTGALLKEGRLVRQGGYDVVDSEYAEHVSRNDTEQRVAAEIAEDLKLDVISALLQSEEADKLHQ